jgi:hypothetical protein
MISPQAKKLRDTFDLDTAQAKLIKDLCAARDYRELLEPLIEAKCPETAAYARSCYNDPYNSRMWRTTLVLHAIDHILGTSGVECIGEGEHSEGYAPPYEYCNAGDTYATTLVYKRASDRLFIGKWGDIVEREGL